MALSQCSSLCVCPWDGEGCSWTLHRKYLLLISPNLEQAREDAHMAGVEHTSMSAPVPSVDSEPADLELSGTAMPDTTCNTSQGSPDQPTPLRHGTCAIWKQLQWRYHKFALLANASLPSILDVWVGLCICLHLISCLNTIFMGSINTLTCTISFVRSTTHFSIEGNSVRIVSDGFLDGGSGQRLFGLSAAAPSEKKPRG